MIRTVITPSNTNINLAIPPDYVGKPVEITFVALEELQHIPSKKTMADFWNVISDETAKVLHQQVEESRDSF